MPSLTSQPILSFLPTSLTCISIRSSYCALLKSAQDPLDPYDEESCRATTPWKRAMESNVVIRLPPSCHLSSESCIRLPKYHVQFC